MQPLIVKCTAQVHKDIKIRSGSPVVKYLPSISHVVQGAAESRSRTGESRVLCSPSDVSASSQIDATSCRLQQIDNIDCFVSKFPQVRV